jgi:hypothetical protein
MKNQKKRCKLQIATLFFLGGEVQDAGYRVKTNHTL